MCGYMIIICHLLDGMIFIYICTVLLSEWVFDYHIYFLKFLLVRQRARSSTDLYFVPLRRHSVPPQNWGMVIEFFLVISFFYAFVGNVCGILMWHYRECLVLWFDDCCVREFDD